MGNHSATLEKIAASVKRMAEAPSHDWTTWLLPVMTALGSVLLGSLLGYWASQRAIRRQEAREASKDTARRRLTFDLLRDEFTLRWQAIICKVLREIVKKAPNSLEGLRTFATVELSGDDMFVCKSVSSEFTDYYFLNDPELISEIIHGYILVRDLIDLRSVVSRILHEYDQMCATLTSSLPASSVAQQLEAKYSKAIEGGWKQVSQKLDEIDARLAGILPKLA